MGAARTYHLKSAKLISAGAFDVSEEDGQGNEVTVPHKFLEFDTVSTTGRVTRHFFDLASEELYTANHGKVGSSFDVVYTDATGEEPKLVGVTELVAKKTRGEDG